MSDAAAPAAADKPAPESIRKTLAALPDGGSGGDLSLDELSTYLRQHYNKQEEIDRNARHALRDELYRDGGVHHMRSWIDKLFTDQMVKEQRKAFVELARFNNVLKRIVNECSTVYSEPAKRVVTKGDQNYQDLLDEVKIDEVMLQAGRLLNLHRALLIGFRVRKRPDGTHEPVIDIATPANVRAIVHPNDSTLVVGWAIKTDYRTARAGVDKPAWTLWTAFESMHLRENMSVIGSSYVTHELGLIPWVPISLGSACAGFWPGNEGEDLTAAHLMTWLESVLLAKESKSATKQTVYSGDGTTVARGQSADSEVPVELAEGQTATTVDMSMDLSLFRDTSDHIVNHVGLNYNLSPALIQHQGVQSAQARDLMRMPIRELRKQQQIPWRRWEYSFVIVMARVVAVDLVRLIFSVDGWRMEFAEAETPLSPLDDQTLFEKQRASGLTNTIAQIVRLRPGITPEQALQVLSDNIGVETNRNVLMRPLQAISGALGSELPSGEVKVTETEQITPAGAAPGKPPGKPGGGTPPAAPAAAAAPRP